MREGLEKIWKGTKAVFKEPRLLLACGIPAGMVLMLILDDGSPSDITRTDRKGRVPAVGSSVPEREASIPSGESWQSNRARSEVRKRVGVVFADSQQGSFDDQADSSRSERAPVNPSRDLQNRTTVGRSPQFSTSPQLDSSQNEVAKSQSGQEETPEALREAVNRYLTDVEQRLTTRIARILALYQASTTEQALAATAPTGVRAALGQSESPVIALHPFSYSSGYLPEYQYDADQQASIRRIQDLDAQLLRLIGHAVQVQDFAHLHRIVGQDRRRVQEYRVLLPEQQALFVLRCREVLFHLRQSPVDGSQLGAQFMALYPLFTTTSQGSALVSVLDQVISTIGDTNLRVQRREDAVREVYSFIERIIRRQTTTQGGRTAQQLVPNDRLSGLFNRIAPLYRSQEVVAARTAIDQLFAKVSQDPHARYDQLMSDPNLMFLTLRLRTIRDAGDTRAYETEYQRCVQLLGNMIAYYSGQSNRSQDVQNLRARLQEIDHDRQSG